MSIDIRPFTATMGASSLNNMQSTDPELKANILLVDDSPAKLLALESILDDLGQTLVKVRSGEEALKALLHQDFAVILLDVNMPGIGGFEVADLIRQRPRSEHTPIIFVSAISRSEMHAFKGYSLGAVDYIFTPIVPEVLRAKVAVFVELDRTHAQLKRQAQQLQQANCSLEREVAERVDTERQLRESHAQLRLLAGHLQSAREEERVRIAREIHDELGQTLTALKMELNVLRHRLANGGAAMPAAELGARLDDINGLLGNSIKAVRGVVNNLRPEYLEEVGLRSAMEWHLQEYQGRTQITCRFNSNVDQVDLDHDCSMAVFRIFQESLTNVARHADASQVDINLKEEAQRLLLCVRDNGKGIRPGDMNTGKTFGILGMQERAHLFGGTVQIEGAQGRGTTVTVNIPRQHGPAPGQAAA